jgi:photosystem II stability/assembly factor-like uncharacterized protein
MPTLFVATNGLSIWTSTDLGVTLARMPTSTAMYSGSRVWALLETPTGLMAGSDSGIYRWDTKNGRWNGLPSPTDVQLITALAVSPFDSNILLAGTQPAAIHRSEDGGQSWKNLHVPMKPFVSTGFFEDPKSIVSKTKAVSRPAAQHWTRVTQILFDTRDPSLVWAGVEIDGAWLSKDGGRTFTRHTAGLMSEDVHGFAVFSNGSRTVFATTNAGLHTSADNGENWTFQQIDSEWQYTRSVLFKPGRRDTMLLTNGNGAPGTKGRLFRSENAGRNWSDARLPGSVESSVYFLATHPDDPNLVFAAATLGQLFRSDDGGKTWIALPQRLNEIRAIAWLP